MLKLPTNWHEWHAGPLVNELLAQAYRAGRYREAAQAVARAAIEFMLAGPRWKDHQPPPALLPISNGWQLQDWIFYVLPETSDDALHELFELLEGKPDIDVLTPPWSVFLLRHAIRLAYPKRYIRLSGTGEFCDTRLSWTGLDMGESHQHCIGDFLQRYRRITANNPHIKVSIAKAK